eukprot:2802607-Lingulodinium_polyedra.AAC.1
MFGNHRISCWSRSDTAKPRPCTAGTLKAWRARQGHMLKKFFAPKGACDLDKIKRNAREAGSDMWTAGMDQECNLQAKRRKVAGLQQILDGTRLDEEKEDGDDALAGALQQEQLKRSIELHKAQIKLASVCGPRAPIALEGKRVWLAPNLCMDDRDKASHPQVILVPSPVGADFLVVPDPFKAPGWVTLSAALCGSCL